MESRAGQAVAAARRGDLKEALHLAQQAWQGARDRQDERGVLEAAGQRTLGWLVPSAAGQGLDWQPADGGQPLRLEGSARIRYRGLDALGGIGVACAPDGVAWKIVNVEPAGPAGRDGRIRENDRLVSIAQGPTDPPVAVAGLDTDEVRALLRGIVGTTVVLRIAPAAHF